MWKFIKYCLHDCIVNKIEIKDSTLILNFVNGIYEFDDNIKMYKNIKDCNIHINIDNLNENEAFEHISINLFKKNIRKNLSSNEFIEMVKKDNFKIYLDFYSTFTRGILLKGYCKKYEIELLISEINDIQVVFTK